MVENRLPLEEYRVLEFTHAIMGPSAGLLLADMGAEVIRIEPSPHGDPTRRLEGFGTGYYTFYNRNKKSLVVDLKTSEGQEITEKLLKTADALIENFAPNTMNRLGLSYDRVNKINPRLVYCSLKGFQPGPYENRTALDEVVQMMSGLAYMTGRPGDPLRAGASIIDMMGGAFGAFGIVNAFIERQRTGEGKFIQTGLFETAAYVMGQHMAYAAQRDEPVPPLPARVPAWAVYRRFTASDGKDVFVGITSDKHWERFCEVFERPDLFADESLRTNNQRVNEHKRLLPELETFFATLTSHEILKNCDIANIPFAPVGVPEDLFSDEHLLQSNLLDVEFPDGTKSKLPALPIFTPDQDFGIRMQAPKIGEHTYALLSELGYKSEQIDRFVESNVVRYSLD